MSHGCKIFQVGVLYFLTCLFVLLPGVLEDSWAQERPHELRSGWYPDEPYQVEPDTGTKTEVTGLDIQIARELFEQSGVMVSFEPMPWIEILEGLQTGETDFLMGAYYEEGREEYAYYSQPYRTERNALYYHQSVDRLDSVNTLQEVLQLLENEDLRVAVIEGHAYGSEEFEKLMQDPPPNLDLVPSQGYRENLHLAIEDRVDLFVANPVIMDRLIAQSQESGLVRKLGIKTQEIPVHVLFSKKSISRDQLEEFNSILGEMQEQGRIHTLHREYVLPAYLSITTGQTWFTVLNLLGIVAFCTSGVLLARKERYNLFGAMVLATLPAIGGGVLRDLFLGMDQVFVLKTPAYFLVAISVVLLAFGIFKYYDYVYDRSSPLAIKLEQFFDRKLGNVFDQLFKFFDAWAVGSFTVIGVSVALEMKAGPLWLWGPAMAVVTASGGVILRDIVRADFNIEMLKQDTYAEISILGGIVYTCALIYYPYDISLDLIFYLTMFMVFFLFGTRFFILWKGYSNPLQFGDIYTHPDTRLQNFFDKEPVLWGIISKYYTEDEESRTVPAHRPKLEELHNQFLYMVGDLKDSLDQVVSEPLNEKTITRYREFSARLDIAISLEDNLFSFLTQADAGEQEGSDGTELQQLIHESLRTMIDTTAMAVESREHMDFTMLEGITSKFQQRFNDLRDKYSARVKEQQDNYLKLVLHSTHKVERIIYLLSDYVRLRLHKKDTRTGSATNRRAQQAHVLH